MSPTPWSSIWRPVIHATLVDPELVDQHVPVGVELVVAYPGGEECQVARVVQRYPRCLGVGLRVAEFRLVEVVWIVGEEGAAGEQRVDEVGGCRVVLVPGEESGLYPVAGVAKQAPVAGGGCRAQRCPVSDLVENC